MELQVTSLVRYSHHELSRMFNTAFEKYIIPVEFDAESFSDFLASNQVDPRLSAAVFDGGAFCGIGLIARFDGNSRIVGMGVAAPYRGRGVGRWLLRRLLADASTRGDGRLLLEVVEQNEPAVGLYRKHGFQTVRRLCGFEVARPAGQVGPLERISGVELVGALASAVDLNLPWQIGLPNLIRLDPTDQAHRVGRACVATSDPSGDAVQVKALFTTDGRLEGGDLERCLGSLFGRFPDKTWVFGVLFPAEYTPLLTAFGASPNERTQLQMEKCP